MSVAAATPTETKATRTSLWVEGLKFAVYVLAVLGVVFYGVPHLWETGVSPRLGPAVGKFVNVALMLVADLSAAVLLVIFGIGLIGPNPAKGLRGATFLAFVSIFAGFFLIRALLSIFEQMTKKFELRPGGGTGGRGRPFLVVLEIHQFGSPAALVVGTGGCGLAGSQVLQA